MLSLSNIIANEQHPYLYCNSSYVHPMCEVMHLSGLLGMTQASSKHEHNMCSHVWQVRREHEDVRKRRLDEFMAGFNCISLRLKEMYQMITLGGDAELELVDSLDPFSEACSLPCGTTFCAFWLLIQLPFTPCVLNHAFGQRYTTLAVDIVFLIASCFACLSVLAF